MTEAVEVQEINVRCDACGHEAPVAIEEVTEAMIGRQCPRCSTTMVTAEDVRQMHDLRRHLDALNARARTDPGAFTWADTPEHGVFQTTPAGVQVTKTVFN